MNEGASITIGVRGQVPAATSAAGPTYRYRVRAVGRMSTVFEREITCTDDGDALTRCCCILGDYAAVEAWEGDRLVCRMWRPL